MKKSLILIVMLFLVQACANKNILQADEDYLKNREVQTAEYDDLDYRTLLFSTAAVLQDIGFTIYESNVDLGIVSAYKDANATDAADYVNIGFAAAAGAQAVYKISQRIMVSMSVTELKNDKNKVRVIFQRDILMSNGTHVYETLDDEDIYQGFFRKLDKSIFLTKDRI